METLNNVSSIWCWSLSRTKTHVKTTLYPVKGICDGCITHALSVVCSSGEPYALKGARTVREGGHYTGSLPHKMAELAIWKNGKSTLLKSIFE